MNSIKVKELEQSRNALIRYPDEGLAVLDTLKAFEGDVALAAACKEAILFYKKTAENDMPTQTGFFLKQEEFEKLKKTFEAKREKTKADVNEFNKGVKDINIASNNFTKVGDMLNTTRAQILQKWNEAEKDFADRHMPRYNK